MDFNRLTKRLPGFTLMELLVGIALTSLTMLLGYSVLRFVEASLKNTRDREAQAWESQLLWKSLEGDSRFLDSLAIGQHGIELFRKSDSISMYALTDVGMLRLNGNRIDTFEVRGSWIMGNQSLGWNDSLLLDTLWITAWPEASAQPYSP